MSDSKLSGTPTAASEDSILAECSDDEEYDRLGFTALKATNILTCEFEGHDCLQRDYMCEFGNYWSPHAADVADLYETMSKTKDKALEYTWKCPGRRNPDQEVKQELKKEEPAVVPKTSEPEATDFDFEEESTPFMRRVPGKTIPLKTSAKKKTSSLTGILANMERHRIMDQMASVDAPNPAIANNTKSPMTTITTTTTSTETPQ